MNRIRVIQREQFMPLVPFNALMRDAQRKKYAVGYFEAWNLESLLAVADAAETTRSPILLGFSGIYLPHPHRRTREHLQDYFALAHSVASRLTVPACLVFNESPHLEWVKEAIELGFGLVMFSDEPRVISGQDSVISDQDSVVSDQYSVVSNQSPVSSLQSRISNLQSLSQHAHEHNLFIEAEMESLAGVGGELETMPDVLRLTDANAARDFVAQTHIDALAVNIGQAHMHGRQTVRLDLERLRAIREVVDIPLVLHGATSVAPDDLRAAIEIGVQKINVGSALKRVYFQALKKACAEIGASYNPYKVMGSGLDADVLTTARLAMQHEVQEWIQLFGGKGKTE